MRWLVAMAILGLSSAYLYRRYVAMAVPPASPPATVAAPIKPLITSQATVFSAADIERIKVSARDPHPEVRWAAIELLFALREPEVIPLLEDSITRDSDPSSRVRALRLLQQRKGLETLQGLLKGLRDPEPEVRIAALQGVAESGEPAAIAAVAQLATADAEATVRAEALRTLGQFQDKRRVDFEELTSRLRRDYEAAVERAAQKRPAGH